MFNCFKINRLTYENSEDYPKLCYVPLDTYKNGCPIWASPVFETEKECQQYCIDMTTETSSYNYYTATFIPPTSEVIGSPNYPNYVYPILSKRTTDTCYIPNPPYAFANENDASDFVSKSNNKDISTMYSIQTWVAAGTYNPKIHGFTGLKFFSESKVTENGIAPLSIKR